MTHARNARHTQPTSDPWWSAIQSTAETDTPAQGLTSAQSAEQLAKFGPNVFHPDDRHTLLRQFLSRFKNPLVVVLLLASSVSAMTGEVTNFAIISVIVMLSVTCLLYTSDAADD